MKPKILGLALISPRVEALSFVAKHGNLKEPVRWEHYTSMDNFTRAEAEGKSRVSGIVMDLDYELTLSQAHKETLRGTLETYFPLFRLHLVETLGQHSQPFDARWQQFLAQAQSKKLRDQRAHPRVHSYVSCRIQMAGYNQDCFTADLSLGGCCLVMKNPPPSLATVWVDVEGFAPGLRARVAWSRPLRGKSSQIPGCGLQFFWDDPKSQSEFQSFLASPEI